MSATAITCTCLLLANEGHITVGANLDIGVADLPRLPKPGAANRAAAFYCPK
jgi:hypothetical protein